jgi:hypothetical protein
MTGEGGKTFVESLTPEQLRRLDEEYRAAFASVASFEQFTAWAVDQVRTYYDDDGGPVQYDIADAHHHGMSLTVDTIAKMGMEPTDTELFWIKQVVGKVAVASAVGCIFAATEAPDEAFDDWCRTFILPLARGIMLAIRGRFNPDVDGQHSWRKYGPKRGTLQ